MPRKSKRRAEPGRSADHRLRGFSASADFAPIEISDPEATRDGETIVVLRRIRNDPLARLHSHRQIDEAQYLAGRAYQRDWEIAERTMRSLDPTRVAVDGGERAEPLSERQISARNRLIEIERVLGRRMHRVVHAVLIEGETIEKVTLNANYTGETWIKFYGRLFRQGLEELAIEYRFAGRTPQGPRTPARLAG